MLGRLRLTHVQRQNAIRPYSDGYVVTGFTHLATGGSAVSAAATTTPSPGLCARPSQRQPVGRAIQLRFEARRVNEGLQPVHWCAYSCCQSRGISFARRPKMCEANAALGSRANEKAGVIGKQVQIAPPSFRIPAADAEHQARQSAWGRHQILQVFLRPGCW